MKKEKNSTVSFIAVSSVVAFFCMLICCIALYYNNFKVSKVNVDAYQKSDADIRFCFDELKLKKGKYLISGWALKEGTDIGYANNTVLLKNLTNNEYYKVKTKFIKRSDVTAHINDGKNYDNSGFQCRVNQKQLSAGIQYKVCFLYQTNGENILFETEELIRIDKE